MAESNSLLNCRTGNRTAGSNPALSAIFLPKKWRTKPQGFTSLCEAQLHSKGAAFSSHLHKKREALLVKSLHFIPLVKTFRLRSTCEVSACRRVDVFLFTALRLYGGEPSCIFFLQCYINSTKEIILWLNANCVHFPLILRYKY